MKAANDNGQSDSQVLAELREQVQSAVAELGLMREQLTALVHYMRGKEAAAIKRRDKLHTRVDIPIVRKHRPTEEEVQQALRHQISREARRR